jgi:hypothetical protein
MLDASSVSSAGSAEPFCMREGPGRSTRFSKPFNLWNGVSNPFLISSSLSYRNRIKHQEADKLTTGNDSPKC